jgi:UDP-N-acetylglucosamine--N-acetylmuramyl-(pentapeptide) pyrophosphoryl-undecaprenol N-acetylglucosamine transferase
VIFVTIGTSEPFDRLIAALPDDASEELVVQCGQSSMRPAGAEIHEYLSYDELVTLVRRARVVVCHAGVGTILTALANGRRPIVVPRLARHGEAVDDHQVALARRLADVGLVLLAEDPSLVPQLLADADAVVAEAPRPAPALLAELSSFVANAVRRPA